MAVMPGVSISINQPSGITTTWSTFIDISWQPMRYAAVQVGHYLSESAFQAGNLPLATDYFVLDITQINPSGNIPAQILSQLTASGALLAGGTITTT